MSEVMERAPERARVEGEVEGQPAPGEVSTELPGESGKWQASEAVSRLAEEGETDEPKRPSSAGNAVDAVGPARVYGASLEWSARLRELGRYVVLDVLGRGGVGVVLRAYDRQLDRAVALKVLRRALDERHRLRLRREAQAMAKLSHPNVVQVYEVGEVDGQTFVAMELVKGKTVRDWMNRQPRPGWRACVELFGQLGAGLVAAHEQGLVHRDFKPGNAMIDDKGRARVLDFGMVRLKEDEAADDPSATLQKLRRDIYAQMPSRSDLTQTGMVLGTPAYMAPEQMGGEPTDPRSDQFSFCVTLYEVLYGERPYEGDLLPDLFASMCNGVVRPAPAGSDVPQALRRVLLRGLATAPGERWPSMEALLEALRGVAAPRRRRGIAVVAGVGLLAIGGGLGAMWTLEMLERCTGARKQLAGVWDDARRQEVKAAILGTQLPYAAGTWERVEPQLDGYADAWAAEHTDACEATHSRGEQSEEEMSLRMGCLHQRWQYLRATVGELGRADATVAERAVQAVTSLPGLSWCRDLEALRAEVPPPEDPAVVEQVAVLDEILVEAKAKQAAGRYEEGLRLADEVVDEGRALDYAPLMARAWQQQGRLRINMGDYEGAVEVLRRAYQVAVTHTMKAEAADVSTALMLVLGDLLVRHEEARGWAEHAQPLSWAAGTDDARAGYLDSLGKVADSEGKYEEARDLCGRALAIRQRALGSDHPDVALSLDSLGSVAYWQGKYEEARDFHRRALAIREKVLGPDHPDVATSLNSLGIVAKSKAEYDKASKLYERSRVIWENALGADHPTVAISLTNLGRVAYRRGNYEEAREFNERALAIRQEALGPDHPHVAFTLNFLSDVANSQGKYEEVRELNERALAISEKSLDPDHPFVALSLEGLGDAAYSQGEYEQAREFYERALAIREKTLGPGHPKVAASLDSLGHVAKLEGRYEQARELYERALAIREEALGAAHPEVATSFDSLGRVAHRQAEYEQARELHERALGIREEALGPDHPEVASSLHGLGNVAHSQGKYEQARALYERALGIREEALGPEHPEVARLLSNLGFGADLQGKHEEAQDFHERALAIMERAFGRDHPDVASSLNNLGRVVKSQGKYEEAQALYERALGVMKRALGPEHPYIAYPLTGLGAALLGLGRPVDALPVLERALAIRNSDAVDPAELAETRFALARALWTVPAAQGRDRPRARTLAQQARTAYAALGDAWKAQRAETETWLVEHVGVAALIAAHDGAAPGPRSRRQ
ncbi:MAG: tetratricopeptide repeat protein [Myxococcota bacterium]